MGIRIVEIHKADSPTNLNSEWFVLENIGETPFSTRKCTIATSRGNSKKRRQLGDLDPGFVIAPGARARVITGNPAKKAHGKPPQDDLQSYNLFLNAPIISSDDTTLVFALRQHTLATAAFDPTSATGVKGGE